MRPGARRILLLAGTAEGRETAAALAARPGWEVRASLAGATADPAAYPCPVRIGGFGGAAGLAAYLAAERIAALVDATHPFAETITGNAVAAAASAGVPYLRLERPGWAPVGGADWCEVADLETAAAAPPPGARALLAIGVQGLAPFAARRDVWWLARVIQRPAAAPDFASGAYLEARPPYRLEAEQALMRAQRITHLIAKNSGGPSGWAKIAAAAALGVETVLIRRPAPPDAPRVDTIDAVMDWLDQVLKT